MSAAAYRHLARQMQDSDLFRMADLIRETTGTPGWKFVADSIGEHRQKMLDQLLNETVKAEEIPRLRGLISGLASMEQAAQSILESAEERERQANARVQQETHA